MHGDYWPGYGASRSRPRLNFGIRPASVPPEEESGLGTPAGPELAPLAGLVGFAEHRAAYFVLPGRVLTVQSTCAVRDRLERLDHSRTTRT